MVMAAPTCEDEISQADTRINRLERLEMVSDDFTSESLSARNLEAFEFKAIEKLMDYADYLEIIYSEGFAESFREQARQNITGFFNTSEISETAIILKNISGSYNSYHIRIDPVDIINPLHRETDTRYTGSMSYDEMILGISSTDTILISHYQKTIGIILQMAYKDFGENSLLVWEVLLGEITSGD